MIKKTIYLTFFTIIFSVQSIADPIRDGFGNLLKPYEENNYGKINDTNS